MKNNYKEIAAPPEQVTLYCLIGESICSMQHLEEALSQFIVMKTKGKITKAQADQFLEKQRLATLGNMIKSTKKELIFSDDMQNKLEDLTEERNWLVHKLVPQIHDDLKTETTKNTLFNRIKAIDRKVRELLMLIEEDMMKYCEDNGTDMSKVKEEIEKYYA